MKIPIERWYQAIQDRHSRRKYLPQAVEPDVLASLKDLAVELNQDQPTVRIKIVAEEAPEIYSGIIGSYGSIKGAPVFAAFICQLGAPHHQTRIGYAGEALVLEATAQGLGTCWVSGYFKPELVADYVDLDPGEEIIAISPLGYVEDNYSWTEKLMSTVTGSHNRKSLEKLCTEEIEPDWPDWIMTALEAARLAPSAVNRQPWRFTVTEDSILVAVDDLDGENKRLDCGIAMLHLEVGAKQAGVNGTWEYLDSPLVAEFTKQKE